MQAGPMNQRVIIQARAAGQDEAGQSNGAWNTLATLWAAVEPLRGTQFFAAAAAQSSIEMKVRIRHREDITPSMRLQHRGVNYDISAVIPNAGQKDELWLMCASGVRDAR